MVSDMMEQKIKPDGTINIGANIRSIRKERGIGQTELVGLLQVEGITMTRETFVKIERGIQHIQVSQLRAIRDALLTTYDELLAEAQTNAETNGTG
jgi:transcriptional regulator with XRE-family HTH domain